MFENMTFARGHLALRSVTQRMGGPPLPKEVPVSTSAAFHLFPRLPYEIRIQIWYFSVLSNSPRVIELRQSLKFGRVKRHSPTARVGSNLKPPAILSACRESREVAKGGYILHNEHLKVFFNPEVDILYIGEHTSSKCLRDLIFYSPREELGRVKRLVVQRNKLDIFRDCVVGLDFRPSLGWKAVFDYFTGLEELFVTYEDPLLCPCHEHALRTEVCSRCRDKGQRINGVLFGWRLITYQEFMEARPAPRCSYRDILRAPRSYLVGHRAPTHKWRTRRPRHVWSKGRKACVSVFD
jgi:hypothetical protein